MVKLVAFAEGDRTVGDGTFTASFETDAICPSDIEWVKQQYVKMLSDLWDIRSRYIHVFTKEEYEAYTRAEEKEESF